MPRAHYHSLLVPDLTCQYRDDTVQRHSSLIVVWRVWKPVKAAPMFWGEFVAPSVWKRFVFCCVNMNVVMMLGPLLFRSHQATTAWHCHPSIVKMSGKVERRLQQQCKLIPWDMSFPVFHGALNVSVSVFHRALSVSVSVFHRALNLSVSMFHRALNVSVSVFHRSYTPGCIIPLSWTVKQLHADAVLIDQMAKVVASQSIQWLIFVSVDCWSKAWPISLWNTEVKNKVD